MIDFDREGFPGLAPLRDHHDLTSPCMLSHPQRTTPPSLRSTTSSALPNWKPADCCYHGCADRYPSYNYLYGSMPRPPTSRTASAPTPLRKQDQIRPEIERENLEFTSLLQIRRCGSSRRPTASSRRMFAARLVWLRRFDDSFFAIAPVLHSAAPCDYSRASCTRRTARGSRRQPRIPFPTPCIFLFMTCSTF